MMKVEQVTDLLLKHLQGELTPDEQSLLDQWLSGSAHNRHFFNELNSEEQLSGLIRAFHPDAEQINEAQILDKINQLRNSQPAIQPRIHFMRRWGWVAAASIIVLMGIGAYLWNATKNNTHPSVTAQSEDIAPGRSGAILTLADGSQVVLDSLANGVIANQNGTQVLLKDEGLSYDPAGPATGEVAFNTVTTPKGRQFQITLPDGTKVWLNAASSITYPTQFIGKERLVKVSGEVYLEVAKNAAKPFHVNVDERADVEVLGTDFNVNAYADDKSIHTTLLAGAVAVTPKAGARVALKPGQQAQVDGNTATVFDNVNTEKVMAWKNGLFNFEGARLAEVMRQLERWYDIDVVYEKGVPDITFGGAITRGVSLKGLLSGLEGSEVHFRIEGRKLIVLP